MKKLPPFQAIIFDMDGTLHDTEPIMNELDIETGAKLGFKITNAILHKLTGSNRAGCIAVLESEFGKEFPSEQFFMIRDEVYHGHKEANGVPLKPGVNEILSWCQEKKIACAVATSTPHEWAHKDLQKTGIKPFFEVIVGGDRVKNGKPAPDIFVQAVKEMGIAPDQCLAIEDSYNGIRAAHAAKTIPVMIPDTLPVIEEMSRLSSAIFNSLSELLVELRMHRP